MSDEMIPKTYYVRVNKPHVKAYGVYLDQDAMNHDRVTWIPKSICAEELQDEDTNTWTEINIKRWFLEREGLL